MKQRHPDPSINLWINAARSHGPDEIKIDLDNGADPNYSRNNITVLQAAAERGNAGVIKMLIEARADLHKQKESNLATPLHIASLHNSLGGTKELLKARADVNKVMINGFTPLMLASHEGHINVVRLLIQAKADINQKTTTNKPLNVLDCALDGTNNDVSVAHVDVAQVLIKAGADPSEMANKHLIPLARASEKGYENALKLGFIKPFYPDEEIPAENVTVYEEL